MNPLFWHNDYGPREEFLRKEPDRLALYFALSVLIHGLMFAGYKLLPKDQPSSTTQNVTQKGMGSVPVYLAPSAKFLRYGQGSARRDVPIITQKKFLNDRRTFEIPGEKAKQEYKNQSTLVSPSTGSLFLPEGDPRALSEKGIPKWTENSKNKIQVDQIFKEDEYRYSTFFGRLKENLFPLWVKRVRFKVSDKDIAGRDMARTRVKVSVDQRGYIQSVENVVTSGCSSCDIIAQESLLTLGRVDNPPQGFKNSSGLYEFFLTFTIYTQYSSAFIEFDKPIPLTR
jgi:hypothetical protein